MPPKRIRGVLRLALIVALPVAALPAKALPPETVNSVVSVLPVWPGHDQGGQGAPLGPAPEGSGVVLRPGIIATAWHVIEPAERTTCAWPMAGSYRPG